MDILNSVNAKREYLSFLNERSLCFFHDTHRVCGIYAIFNKENGKVYIGKTINKIYRYLRTERLFSLRNGNMHNKELQKDFKKYGEKNFEIFILEKFLLIDEESKEKKSLISTINYLEVYYINKFKANNNNYGYNILIGGENDKTIHEINQLISNEKVKRDIWAYGDFVETHEIPFGIPENYIPKKKIKFPNNSTGLGSVMGLYIKENQQVKSFTEYVNKFLAIYADRDYVEKNKDLIPMLLAQQLIQKFPTISIIRIVSSNKCTDCGKVVSKQVVDFCLKFNNRFKGEIYCYEHQKDYR